jgi:hypothetical protein
VNLVPLFFILFAFQDFEFPITSHYRPRFSFQRSVPLRPILRVLL